MFLTLAAEVGHVEAILAPGAPPLRFADLARRIEQVRDDLSGLGIERGDRVAMILPRSPETAVCSVAVAACATCVPLNPDYTAAELEQYLGKLAPRAIILGSGQAEAPRRVAAGLGIRAIDLVTAADGPAGAFRLHGEAAPRPAALPWASADDMAFILLTSGTTSREKLVPVTHRQILVLAQATGDRFALGPRDRCLHAVPMFHANGLLTALLSPLAAGCGVICPTRADVPSIFAAIEALQPTWFPVGYTVHLALLDRMDADRHVGAPAESETYRRIARRAKLRFMLSSAGSLEPAALRRLEDLFDAPVVERYATSETGMLTANPLPPGIRKPGTVGTPLCNEIQILDAAGAPAGRLEDGEIVVRGPSVFDGYLDDPEANRAAFTDGWFRTGDLGHFDGEGYLVITGRIKELISRGGEKISPVEVERVLTAHRSVASACVFALPHPTLGEEVAAAVVPARPGASSAEELVGFARERLAPFKVPRRIFFVSALPIAATNKVDRHAVARSCLASLAQEAAPAPGVGASALESALSGLWGAVLKRASVGRQDDFFLLGGDSLRGHQLVANVLELFGIDLPVMSLFDEAGTVSGMARMIEAARKGGTRPAAANHRATAAIPRRSAPGPVALSHAQTRAWFLARFEPGDPAYNQPHAYRLAGAVDVDALRASLQAVADRHEIMRTTYAQIDDEPRQIVREGARVELQRLDLSAVPEATREQALRDALAAEARRPFDLEADLPVRFTLITLGEGQHAFLGAWHHIAHDGWSEGVFVRELSAAYNARRSGRTAPRPPLAMQYADYAMWQRERLATPELVEQLRYWRGHLEDLAPLDLPTDHPRPRVQGFTGNSVGVVLPAPLTAAVKALARAERATLFMVLLAGFQVLLHRLSGATDVAVGIPIAGRGRVELEDMIGFFANTLVLRADLRGDPSFREVLAQVRERALSAYANQDVPFEKLVEVLAPPRDPSRNPLFQVAFAMLNMAPPELALDGIEARPLSLPIGTAKFDLTVMLRETGGALHTSWTFCDDLFERATRRGDGAPLPLFAGGGGPRTRAAHRPGRRHRRGRAGPAPCRLHRPDGVRGHRERGHGLRGAGGGRTRRRRRDARGRHAHLPRAERAGPSSRPTSAQPRRGGGHARRRVPRAGAGADRGPRGRAESRSRVRPAGSVRPTRAARLHRGGRRDRPGAREGGGARAPSRVDPRDLRRGRRADVHAARGQPDRAGARAGPRLHPLYLGNHRAPEGRGDPPGQRDPPGQGYELRRAVSGRYRGPGLERRVRRRHLRDLGRPPERRAIGRRAQGRAPVSSVAGRRAPAPWRHLRVPHDRGVPPDERARSRRVPRPPVPALRRRDL